MDDVAPERKSASGHMLQAAKDLELYVASLPEDEESTEWTVRINWLRRNADQTCPPSEGWPTGKGLADVIDLLSHPKRKRG